MKINVAHLPDVEEHVWINDSRLFDFTIGPDAPRDGRHARDCALSLALKRV